MMEPSTELEALLIDAARAAHIDIIRDQLAEIRCSSEAFPDATFIVFWPRGQERLNILVPKSALVARA